MVSIETLDPESQFLLQIRLKSSLTTTQPPDPSQQRLDPDVEDDEFGWDIYNEDVRPLKRGRNVKILSHALTSHSHLPRKHSLLLTRRKLIEAIDEYEGDDPLQPWLQCIKWVQEAFPAAGDSSGLLLIYEQCVRTFWHNDRYKDDLRYFRVWLEYAENCADAELIYKFLDANKIGQSHSEFYISYALHLETKHKTKTANEVFNRGLSINAQPSEKLEAAYRKFIARSMARPKTTSDDDGTENSQPIRSFGTVLARGENRRNIIEVSDVDKKNTKGNRGEQNHLSVYKDKMIENKSGHQAGLLNLGAKLWDVLPSNRERNKENTAIPAKWTSFKVPQRPGSRLAGPPGPAIAVFVDEQCSEVPQTGDEVQNTANLQLKERDEHELKRESELLQENPLKTFRSAVFPDD